MFLQLVEMRILDRWRMTARGMGELQRCTLKDLVLSGDGEPGATRALPAAGG